jgi:hypothetical protein
MTDIPLYESPDDIPLPRPKDEIRFEEVQVRPYGDGRRVKLHFKLTPFLERPSVDAAVTDAQGYTVAALSLIEALERDFDFTLHLRGPAPQGEHTLQLTLFYISDPEQPDQKHIVDERSVAFHIEPPA